MNKRFRNMSSRAATCAKLTGKIKTGKTARPIMRTPKEAEIQKTIMAYLKLKGIEASVTNADRTWGKGGGVRASKVEKGHPDITAVLPVHVNGFRIGLAFYIEVKTPTGTVKPEQRDKLARLAGSGALCLLARAVEDVVNLVDRFKDKEWTAKEKAFADQLLKLALSDRRSKEIRDALKELTESTNGKDDNDNH